MGSNTRDKKPVKAYGLEWVITPFSFIPNASASTSNPTAANVVGPVVVSWTATGKYVVQLNGGAPNSMLAGQPCVETAIAAKFTMDCENMTSTSGQFTMRVYTHSTTNLINFTATTSLQRVHGVILQQASSYTR